MKLFGTLSLTHTQSHAIYLLNNVLIRYKLQAYTVKYSIYGCWNEAMTTTTTTTTTTMPATICWKHLTSHQRKWKKEFSQKNHRIIIVIPQPAEIDEMDWFLCLAIIILILYCDFVLHYMFIYALVKMLTYFYTIFHCFCWHIGNSNIYDENSRIYVKLFYSLAFKTSRTGDTHIHIHKFSMINQNLCAISHSMRMWLNWAHNIWI